MLTLEPSGSRPASKHRVNFDHHQPPSRSIITPKISEFRPAHGQLRSPAQKTSHVDPTLKPSDLRPASKNRANLDHHHPRKNQINRPSHSKQVNFGTHTVNFDPNTKTMSNSIAHKKIKLMAITKIRPIRSSL